MSDLSVYDCGCRVFAENGEYYIRFCNTHEAAPELLEVALLVLSLEKDYSYAPDDWVLARAATRLNELCDAARAAIAKAEGRKHDRDDDRPTDK